MSAEVYRGAEGAAEEALETKDDGWESHRAVNLTIPRTATLNVRVSFVLRGGGYSAARGHFAAQQAPYDKVDPPESNHARPRPSGGRREHLGAVLGTSSTRRALR